MNTPAPMSDSAFPLQLDALVAQREFVRRLARSLLRDDFAADDVAQDVMLTALERPQRDVRSLRGFLATLTRRRVANARRSELRRAEHEARTARAAESDESEMRRSLETAQAVAAEVLALDEPYRGVLLLLYLQGESPAAIAARRGTTPATVRSQHKRALELLRERLDRRHGGKRDAWGMALLGCVARPEPIVPTAGAVAAAAVILVAGGVGWFAWSGHASREPAAPALAASLDARAEPVLHVAALESADAAPAEFAAPTRQQAVAPPFDFDLDTRSAAQLFDLAAAAQSVLRTRLFGTPADVVALAPPPPSGVRGGVARLLERTVYGAERPNVVGIRGGGCYYSFTLNGNSYDRDPQLELQLGAFSSGFAGNDVGAVIDVGRIALDAVDPSGASPGTLAPAAWSVLIRDVAGAEPDAQRAWRDELRALRVRPSPVARVGHTYVVRSISDRSFDVLAAFQVLLVDKRGASIAWRLLRDWPVPGAGVNPHSEVAAPQPSFVPPELERMATDDLEALARRIAQRVEVVLRTTATGGGAAGDARGGTVRVLRGWSLHWLLPERDDGSHYSFATLSHAYDREPDVSLSADGDFDSGFYGGCEGFVVDLGELALDAVPSDALTPPRSSNELARHAWKELWDLRAQQPTLADPRPRALSEAERQRLFALQLDRARAVVGHSYLLRSILPQEHDILVAFEVTAIDEYGVALRWKLLKRW